MSTARVGCSGWVYRHWRGSVYPPDLPSKGVTAGPTLVQLPPRWKRNAERLDEFLNAAPRTVRWAVEVREASWLHEETYEVLRRHGAALCIHDLLPEHPWELTTDWTYVRFHGPRATEAAYQGRYGPDGLFWMAERLSGWLGEGRDVYAYFNNDDSGVRGHRRPLAGRAPGSSPAGEWLKSQ